MSFTVFTNIITVLFCVAVLIQSVRMLRSLKQVREGQLDRTVLALETATAKAHGVLSEMKQTLSTEGAANSHALAEARDVREELHVMIGIANAMAERLMEAASAGSQAEAAPEPAKKPKAQTARARTAPTQRSRAKPTKAASTKARAVKSTKSAGAAKAGAGKTPELVLDAKDLA